MLRKVLSISLLLLMSVWLMVPPQALALGLGVAPAKLDFSVSPGSTIKETLNVINQSDEESQFQVYVKGEFEEWFSITPSEFTLPPAQTKEVEIIVTPPPNVSGEHDTSIYVVSLSSASGLQIGAGIKVPTHIRIVGPSLLVLIIMGVVALVVLTSGILIWKRRRDYAK